MWVLEVLFIVFACLIISAAIIFLIQLAMSLGNKP